MKRPEPISEAQWAAYLDGSLSESEEQAFEAALAANPDLQSERLSLDGLLADLEESEPPAVDPQALALARSGLGRHLKKTKQLPADPHAQPAPVPRQQGRIVRWSGRVAAMAAVLVFGMILQRNMDSAPGLVGEDNSPQIANLDGASLRTASAAVTQEGALPLLTSYQVSGLDFPSGDAIRIQLDKIQRYEIEGGAEQSEIQKTLSYIIRNDQDLTRRAQAVSALAGKDLTPQVRETLIHVMAYDPDAGIRLRTAGLLADFLDESLVAQAFMKLMVDDPSAEVRDFAAASLAALDADPIR